MCPLSSRRRSASAQPTVLPNFFLLPVSRNLASFSTLPHWSRQTSPTFRSIVSTTIGHGCFPQERQLLTNTGLHRYPRTASSILYRNRLSPLLTRTPPAGETSP